MQRRRTLLLFVLSAMLLSWCIPTNLLGAPAGPVVKRVWVAPSHEGMWIVVDTDQDGSALVRAAFKSGDASWQWLQMQGRVKTVAAVEEKLCVGFDEGALFQYGVNWRSPMPNVPRPWRLEQLTTDTSHKNLFALVSARPTEHGSTETKPASDAVRRAIYAYQRGTWEKVTDLPSAVDPTAIIDLSVTDRDIDMISLTAAGQLAHRTYRTDTWSGPNALDLKGPIDRFWMYRSAISDELTVVVLGGPTSKQGLSVWKRSPGKTFRDIGVLPFPEKRSELSELIDVSFAADNIVAAYVIDGTVHLARYDQGARQIGETESVSVTGEDGGGQPSETLAMIAMLVIITVVVLARPFRPESVEPPKGIILADMWRRLLAGIVDILPASILTTWYWSDYFREMSHAGTLTEILRNQQMDDRSFVVTFSMAASVAVYCLLNELIWATTPGKRLFGLRVCSLKSPGTKPTVLQIVGRNVVKAFELSFAPILCVMLFTRFRQRIGDLLVGTIVVQGEQTTGEPPSDG